MCLFHRPHMHTLTCTQIHTCKHWHAHRSTHAHIDTHTGMHKQALPFQSMTNTVPVTLYIYRRDSWLSILYTPHEDKERSLAVLYLHPSPLSYFLPSLPPLQSCGIILSTPSQADRRDSFLQGRKLERLHNSQWAFCVCIIYNWIRVGVGRPVQQPWVFTFQPSVIQLQLVLCGSVTAHEWFIPAPHKHT